MSEPLTGQVHESAEADQAPGEERVLARQANGQFAPGVSGNRAGRPSFRTKFAPGFLKAIETVWEAEGSRALTRWSRETPGEFVRFCACYVSKSMIEEAGGELIEGQVVEISREIVRAPEA